jgi:hypothetical protein
MNHRLWSIVALVALMACARAEISPLPGTELEYFFPEPASLGDWSIAEGPTS